MKHVYTLLAGIGMFGGAYIPMLFGDTNLLDGWGILGSFVGGIFGIWLASIIAKRL